MFRVLTFDSVGVVHDGSVWACAGETIKALQQYTGASIQIDQSFEPTAVTISGQPSAVNLAQVKSPMQPGLRDAAGPALH